MNPRIWDIYQRLYGGGDSWSEAWLIVFAVVLVSAVLAHAHVRQWVRQWIKNKRTWIVLITTIGKKIIWWMLILIFWGLVFVFLGMALPIFLQALKLQDHFSWLTELPFIRQYGKVEGKITDKNSFLLQVTGGLLGVISIMLLVWRSYLAQKQLQASHNQLKASHDQLINADYHKALDLLAQKEQAAQFFGIEILKEMILNSQQPIKYLQLLEKFLKSEGEKQKQKKEKITMSMQAALNIIASRGRNPNNVVQDMIVKRMIDKEEYRPNFFQFYLCGANLARAYLPNANLEAANLSRVNLEFANLNYADLTVTDLTDTNLTGANLERSYTLNQEQLDKAFYLSAFYFWEDEPKDYFPVSYDDIGSDENLPILPNHEDMNLPPEKNPEDGDLDWLRAMVGEGAMTR